MATPKLTLQNDAQQIRDMARRLSKLETMLANVHQDTAGNADLYSLMFGTMEFYGHSGTYGGAETAVRGIDERLASLLHADDYNKTHGGAVLSWDEQNPYSTTGNGGWAHVFRELNPGARPAPYGARSDYVQLFFGLNDVGSLGPSATNQLPLTNAYEAVISRARAAAVFEDNHSSVTYPTGAWTHLSFANSADIFASSRNYAYAPSGKVRVTTPADFPGGTVALCFISGSDGSGALWDLTVDSSSIGQIDSRNVNAHNFGAAQNVPGRATPVVKRIKNLSAGAHTIEATINTVNVNGIFDCWWIEAPTPPLVCVPLFWQPRDYSIYSTWPYSGINDADRIAMNGRIQTVVNGFDSDVFTVKTDDLITSSMTALFYDMIHLNDAGHALVTARILSSIIANQRTLAKQASGDVEPPFIGSAPHDTARNVIQAQHPDIVPFTVRGRIAGDQTAALIRAENAAAAALLEVIGGDGGAGLEAKVLSQNSAYFAILEVGRTKIEGQLGVAAANDQFATGVVPGDVVLRTTVDSSGHLKFVSQAAVIGDMDFNSFQHRQKGSFSAYRNAALNITNSETVIVFDAEDFDVSNWYDTSNGRYTPTIAGYYRLSATVNVSGMITAKLLYLVIYKNGVQFKYGPISHSSQTGNFGATISAVVQANGTDYYQIAASTNDTTARAIITTTGNNFAGEMIARS